MVSRQEGTLYSRKRDLTFYEEELHNSFKKTKQEDQSQGKVHDTMFNERPNSESLRSLSFDFELHLHTPLPSDWKTKGYSRTSKDKKTCPKEDPLILGRPKMSLDLELNLSPSGSPSPSRTTMKKEEFSNHNDMTIASKCQNLTNPSKKTLIGTGLSRSSSWLAFEGDDDDDDNKEQEMVTSVCMKCHMLVMLSTSTPVCPNCKFTHPQDHSSTKLFKPSNNLLRLLC